MIDVEVIRPGENHFLVASNEPVRIEVLKTDTGEVVAHIYRGAEVDKEQEPIGLYDGNLPASEQATWYDPSPSEAERVYAINDTLFITFEDLLKLNSGLPRDMVYRIASLKLGEKATFGGGAYMEWTIRRIKSLDGS